MSLKNELPDRGGTDYSWPGPLVKPSATARRIDKNKRRQAAKNAEANGKAKARRRDRGCRFPLCGCKKIGLKIVAGPEVSHATHKGMGGNPAGDRSTAETMLQLCTHRHQHGRISRHAGTMRAVPLRKVLGYNGPVRWQIDRAALEGVRLGKRWTTVAEEIRPGVLAPLTDEQRALLERLARMDV